MTTFAKKHFFVSAFCMLCINVSSQVSFGSPELINDNWKFVQRDVQNAQTPDFDDKRWQNVDLPHDWSVRNPLNPSMAAAQGFLPGGIGWYRKTVNIPADKKGEKVYLYFEGVYNRSEVFVNGQSVGKRPNGYVSFSYDVTPFVKFGESNTVAVCVDHSKQADSRWYTGSGIYRNVWVVYANPVHIAEWGVFAYPTVAKNQGTLNVEIEIENGSNTNANLQIMNELVDNAGKTVAKNSQNLNIPAKAAKSKTSLKLSVKNPKLWDLDNPYLYKLKTTVLQAGKVIDKTETTTGFRTFAFSADNGFYLNGKNLKVKGVCIHHDAGVLGAAVPREVWEKRLKSLKEIGVNAIRTSHNPQAPELYDLFDQYGFLVKNEAYDEWEFPKRKWIEGWNVGEAGSEGAYDFFEEWGEIDLADMVRRDRNHVSVFAWSIGNEVDYPNDPYSHPILAGNNADFTQPLLGGYVKDAPDANRLGDIAKRLVAVVKKYDPTRPTTAGLAGVAMSNETAYPDALDIAGYNYTESRYISDHKKYPKRVIFGSETRHDLAAWKAVTDNKHIFGQFLWTGIDYLGESGTWPSRGSASGLIDLTGEIKPRGYFRQTLWSEKPVVMLGTFPNVRNRRSTREDRGTSMDAYPIWNYEDGQSVRVFCYTNAAKARLELNGKEVGALQNYNDSVGIIFWDVPYADGKLEVIGFDKNNKEIVRYAIQSSKQPSSLTIVSAEKVIDKNKGLAQIMLQVVDENGVPVLVSDSEITCTVRGQGKLLGLEAANLRDTGSYTDNVQRAYHGKLLAYVQATGEAGEITVRFTSPLLKAVEAKISVK